MHGMSMKPTDPSTQVPSRLYTLITLRSSLRYRCWAGLFSQESSRAKCRLFIALTSDPRRDTDPTEYDHIRSGQVLGSSLPMSFRYVGVPQNLPKIDVLI